MNLKGFYKSLAVIALPITFQSLLQTFVNMLDTIMIGQLGSIEIAAVGLGNQVFFVLNMILFGISSGGGVFIAQFWGKKDIKGIRKSLGIMLTLVIIVSFVFTVLCLVMPYKLLGLYSPDAEVIAVGGDYLRWVCLSYVMFAISFAYTLSFRSTEHVKLPFVSTAISMATNVVLNYVLIFAAGWGVKGAAIATVISRFIELCVLLIWSHTHNYEACGKIKELLDFDISFVKRFAKIAIPVIVNESFWGLGISVQNGIFAHAGTDAITAYNITGTISQLTWVFCMGFGNGMSVIIGKKIGEGEKETAIGYAKRSLWFMPLLGAAVGIFLLPLSKTLPFFFKVDGNILETATQMLLVLIFAYPFNSFCMNWVVGVCRAGGDTVFSAVTEIITLWGYAIPFGFLAAFVFHWPAVVIYICVTSESLIKGTAGFVRVLSGKWLHDVTK